MNTDAPWPDLIEAQARVLGIQTKLHQWATDVAQRHGLVESRMRGNAHVRFGGASPGKRTLRKNHTAPRPDPYLTLAGSRRHVSLRVMWCSSASDARRARWRRRTVAIVIEPACGADLLPLVLEAYGLTARKPDVATLVARRLSAGIDVADIGCGQGHAINLMAQAFPARRFVGFDFSETAIAVGRREAEARGLDNAPFEVRDVATLDAPEQFDLVTAFDAIHDQAHPGQVLTGTRRHHRAWGRSPTAADRAPTVPPRQVRRDDHRALGHDRRRDRPTYNAEIRIRPTRVRLTDTSA